MRRRLLLALCCALSVTILHAQSTTGNNKGPVTKGLAPKVGHGREAAKGEVNFTTLAHYLLVHPEMAVRREPENEDDDQVPARLAIPDPSLVHRRDESARSSYSSSHMSFLPVSQSPTDTFESTLDNATYIPPDTHGGVDSNYCVTAINAQLHIQSRTGTNVSTVTLNSFFSSVYSNSGTFDPRVHYDPTTHRWILVCVADAQASTSCILIAISKTSNPTGSWWTYKITADGTGVSWLDYPDVGFNGKWIAVTGNLFPNSGSGYNGAKIFVFNKATLMAGTGAGYTSFIETGDFTICPALTYDVAESSLFAVESYNGTGGYMNMWKIAGAVGSETLTHIAYPTTSMLWFGSANSGGNVDGFAPQHGSSNHIQVNDDRVTQCIQMNGQIWFAHTVFLPYSTTDTAHRSSVQWWQTDTMGNPVQVGRIDDASGVNFYGFPTIAVNTTNDAMIGFSTFSANTYASAGYALRLHTDPTDSIRPLQIYRHGMNSYYKTYGGTRNRWGDYSGTMVDPLNGTDFWTIQEAAASTANTWDTWWAHVQLTSCAPGTIAGTETLCPGSSTTLTETVSGGTWSSSNTTIATVGSTTGVVSSGSVAGTTTITYTVSAGCYATAVVTVTALPPAIAGTKTVCSGLTTSLSDATTGGSWTSSNTSVATVSGSGVVTGMSGGTTVITYTLTSGCFITAVVTVNASPAAITGATAVCIGSTTALTDATTGGTWASSNTAVGSVGASTGIVAGLSAGTTIITYTLGGCRSTIVVTVTTTPAAISGSASLCLGATITLSDATTGGSWTSSNTTTATVGLSTGVVTGLAAGTTVITYSLGTGCFITKIVAVNTAPSAITGSASICIGATLALSDATSGGTWSSSNVAVGTINSSTGIVTGIAAGTTNITYTLPGGCYVAGPPVTVTATPGAILGTKTVCSGLTTSLSDATAGGSWSSSNTATATVGSAGLVSGVAAGTTVITYGLGTGCFSTAVVTVNTSPAAISGPTNVCVGATITLGDAIAGGTWSSSNTAVGSVGAGTGMVTGVAAGVANITYTLPGGCNVHLTVTVNANPAVISGTKTVCSGLTTSLSDATAGGIWTSSNLAAANVTASTGLVTGVAAGTASIMYTLSTGCFSAAIVTVNTSPAAISGPTNVCVGATITLGDTIAGGIWSSSNAAVGSVGAGTGMVTGVAAGTVNITYTIPGGCNVHLTVTVNANPAVISGTKTVCSGLTTSLSDATAGGMWTSSNLAAANVTASTGLVTGVAAGTASIMYTLSTGCFSTAVVTVNMSPTAIIGTGTICVGTSSTFVDTTSGGTWSSNNVGVASVGSSTGIVTGVAAGTAIISYTLSDGCRVTWVPTVSPVPAAISGTKTVCAGLTTSLSDATAGGSWSSLNPSVASVTSTGLVSGTTAGITTITYTLATGCFSTVNVTVNAAPAAMTSGVSALCVGATATFVDTTSGGTWSSNNTGVASAGSSTGVVTGVAAGTAIISYTLSDGCRVTWTPVTVSPTPTAISGTKTVCAGLTTSLSDATAGGSWSSSNTGTATVTSTGLVTGVAAGTTVISYSVGSGCFSTAVVTVNMSPAAITGATAVCIGSAIPLNDSVSGGTWSSSNTAIGTVGLSTGVVTGLNSGTTNITYTLGGCNVHITVTVSAGPAAIAGTKVVCSGLTTTLTDATGGGTWGSSNTGTATVGISTGVVTSVASGTTVITYTLSAGCFNTAVVTVNISPSVITGDTAVCVGSTIPYSDSVSGGIWTSSNTAVATVGSSSGIVHGVAAGTFSITYTLPDGCFAAKPPPWPFGTVNPLPAAISGPATSCVGVATTLTDATAGGTWSSSDTTIATVGASTGIVTGLVAGTSVISYTLGSGCGSVLSLHWRPDPRLPHGLVTVCVGSSVTLSDSLAGGTWSSSNTSVATIGSSSGILTGLTAGTTNITYTVAGCFISDLESVLSGPVATLSGSPLCTGSLITMVSTMPYSSVAWYDGSTLVRTDVPTPTPNIVSIGTGDGIYPIGNFMTPGGDLYVVDNNNRVLKYPAGFTSATSGTVVAAVGLNGPWGVWVDASGYIYVGNGYGANVIVFPPGSDGTTTGTVVAQNGIGTETGDVAVDATGNVFVADAYNNRVLEYPAGSDATTAPAVVATGFTYVFGMAVVNDTIYAADYYNATIYRFDPTGGFGAYSTGTIVAGGNGNGAGANQLYNPAGVTLDNAGNLYVSDNSNQRVQKFPPGSTSSTNGVTVAGGNGFGSGSNQLTYVYHTSVDVAGDLFVGDAYNYRVQAIYPGTDTAMVDTLTPAVGGIYRAIVTSASGCTSTSNTVTVNTSPSVASISGASSACQGSTANLTDATTGGSWSSANTSVATVNSTGMVTGVSAGVTTISYSVTGTCGTASATYTFTVNAVPAVTINPNPANICPGGNILLTSNSGGSGSIMLQDFNSGFGAWTTDNTGTTNSSGVAVWLVEPNGFYDMYGRWYSPDFTAYAEVNGYGTSLSDVSDSRLISPVFSLAGATSATLTFQQAYFASPYDYNVEVDVSTDGGSTWGLLHDYKGTSIGSATNYLPASVDMTPYVGQTNLQIRFYYYTYYYGYYWALDNVQITASGIATPAVWSPVTSLFTDSGLTIPYTGTSIAGVYAAPATTATYTATVTSGGCSGSGSRTVTVSAATNPGTISGPSAVYTGSGITLSETVSGGSWSASNGNATVNSSGLVTGVTAGTVIISYSVTGACGTAFATTLITVYSSVTGITGNTNICAGTTSTLADSTAGGTWNSSNSAVATVSGTSGVVTGVSAGTAYVSYTAGGSTTSVLVTVLVGPLPINGASSVCVGSTITLSDVTGGGSWISSNSNAAIDGSGDVTGETAGTSTISYLLSDGCITTYPMTVLAVPAPITGLNAVCVGGSTTLADTTSGGLSWTSSNTAVATTSGYVVTGVSVGSATITYRVTSGCYATTSVNVIPSISGSIFAGGLGHLYECPGVPGENILLQDADYYLDISLTVWSSSNTSVATVGPPGGAAAEILGISGGTATISYTLTSAAGCLATQVITINPATAITGGTTVCTGATSTLTNSVSGGTWSAISPETGSASIGVTSGIVTGISAGTVTILYVNSFGCGTTTPITVNAAPAAITGSTALCLGGTATLADTTSGGVWTSSNTSVATVGSGTGVVTGTGTAAATITYAAGGCLATITVTVSGAPSAILGTKSVCTGSTTTLSDGTAGGSWSSAAGSGSVSFTGTGAVTVTGVTAGTATMSYTTGSGCSAIAVVTVSAGPSAITGNVPTCIGSTLALTDAVSGGTWSSSNTATATVGSTGIVTGVGAGVVVITYSTGGSCFATANVTVNASIGIITGPSTVCQGLTIALSDATTGGVWSSSNPAIGSISTTGVVTGLSVGSTNITYTVGGCNRVVSITVNSAPSAIGGTLSICGGTTTTLTDATGGGVWSLTSSLIATIGSSTGVVTASSTYTGTTTVSYTLGGCPAIAVLTVVSKPNPIQGATSECIGVTITLSDATSGGVWSSSNGDVTFSGTTGSPVSITGAIAGASTITYSLGAGCYVTIANTAYANPSPITGSFFVCTGLTTTLSDATAGGAWTSSAPSVASASGYTITGVTAGTAIITYKITAGNCIATQAVTVNTTPVVTAISGPTSISHATPATLSDATAGGVWTSSNTAVISLSGSTGSPVTATAVTTSGTSTISYAVASLGCTVTVTKNISAAPAPPSHGGTGTTTLFAGATVNLAGDAVTGLWTSSDNGIASVDAYGTVTGINPGFANITHTITNNGDVTTNVTTIEVTALPMNVSVIPNPNKGTFTVNGTIGSTQDEEVTLEVTDVLGQVIYKNKTTAQGGRLNEMITLSNVANGMYLLNVHSTTGNKAFHFVIEQ